MYLHEENIYLISNHAVARNSIFCDRGIQYHFKRKMEFYLEPLCDILAYNLNNHEFQILVRLKERKAFVEFYQLKMESRDGHFETPESTYIFSQAMSNLQNSTVKKFNLKYNRRGTLMAGRFNRELISGKDRVIELIQDLNNGSQAMCYPGIWAKCAMKRVVALTSGAYYRSLELEFEGVDGSFWSDFKNNLVGQFDPKKVNVRFFKFNFLNRRIFNSICKHFG
jgi:hypothetical protein